jgi:hypothetical protein
VNTAEIPVTAWRKSTYSNDSGNCVEVRLTDPAVALRDTKDRDGPVLTFGLEDWRAFTVAVRDGEFDLA